MEIRGSYIKLYTTLGRQGSPRTRPTAFFDLHGLPASDNRTGASIGTWERGPKADMETMMSRGSGERPAYGSMQPSRLQQLGRHGSGVWIYGGARAPGRCSCKADVMLANAVDRPTSAGVTQPTQRSPEPHSLQEEQSCLSPTEFSQRSLQSFQCLKGLTEGFQSQNPALGDNYRPGPGLGVKSSEYTSRLVRLILPCPH